MILLFRAPRNLCDAKTKIVFLDPSLDFEGHSHFSLFGLDNHALLASAFQRPMMDLKNHFCLSIGQASGRHEKWNHNLLSKWLLTLQ